MAHPTPQSPPILRLLGGAVIEQDGAPLGGPAAHRHRLALLALLAVSRLPLSRDKLMAYLWPERDTESGRNLLRTALYELRKLLGENAIRNTGDALSIDPALLRCDVVEFEAAVAAGDFATAATVYSGPFLDGFFIKEAEEFEHWAEANRVRLERMHEGVIASRGDVVLPPPKARPLPTPPETEIIVADVPPKRVRRWPLVAAAALIAGVMVIGVVLRMRDHEPVPVVLAEVDPGSALEFDGVTANASTPMGTVVTTQSDNIAVDMMVKYEGALSPKAHQTLYYNGHGAWTGWGLMVVGRGEGRPDGTITVLSGGINVRATPFVLKKGVWQHVSAERREGRITVTLDDSSYEVSPLAVNPLGGSHKDIERTSVGGDGTFGQPSGPFHGTLDRLRIRDLAGAYWIERWFFDEGKGKEAVGRKNTVLNIGTAHWVAGAPISARDGFWARLEALCGQAFNGHIASDSGAVLFVQRCEPNELWLGIHAGADRSRALVLTRRGQGMTMQYELHKEDGSLVDEKRFVGNATGSGTIETQSFAGEPEGESWQATVVPLKSLTIESQSARMKFDLSLQVATPPPAWGIRP